MPDELRKQENTVTINELEKLKPLLPGAQPGGTCGECRAPAVATVHLHPGHTEVCAQHLEPYASEDVCDCHPTTGKCFHHRRDATGVCLGCGRLEAANDERYRREKAQVAQNVQLRFRCRIVDIKRDGKDVAAVDVPVAWEVDESFGEGKATVYRFSGVGPDGVRFSAEMTARDLSYSGHGWPTEMSEDLVMPTFQRLLAGWERPSGAGLEHVPTSELYAARTRQLEEERAGRGLKEK